MSERPKEVSTWVTVAAKGLPRAVNVRRCRLSVIAGPDQGKVVEVASSTIQIGRVGADLNLTDVKVSGLHCELRLKPDGYRLRDLGSTNGTYVKNVRIVEAFIQPGTAIQVGKSVVTFDALDDAVALPLWSEPRLHNLVGRSAPMRELFEMINRFAQSNATVLIHGETGAGKEGVADALHQCSMRKNEPFIVLDCSAIPEQLFEAQLFGYEVGAFTGAVKATPGVFEMAHGGTLFLDEIGELPLDIQSKLLRAVETRNVRRLGGTKMFAADVRLVAATNRDLAVEVNNGTFRSDLYYRLAVARLNVPPLRERRDDIELLARHFIDQLGLTSGATDPELPPEFLERAMRYSWPGNVRELRNAVERTLLWPDNLASVFEQPLIAAPTPAGPSTPARDPSASPAVQPVASAFEAINLKVPLKIARQRLLDDFDRRYLSAALETHQGNISAVARTAGFERMSIYKMMRRLGLDQRDGIAQDASSVPDDDGSAHE